MSTIKYHMLPLCGTNPTRRQALLGRPAIAGCAPMPPRCRTSAPVIRRPLSFPGPHQVLRFTSHVSPSPSMSNCPARRHPWAKKQAVLQLSQLLIIFCFNLGLIAIIAIFPPISPMNFFSHDLATFCPPAPIPWPFGSPAGRIPLQREKTARLDQPFALSRHLFALDPRPALRLLTPINT